MYRFSFTFSPIFFNILAPVFIFFTAIFCCLCILFLCSFVIWNLLHWMASEAINLLGLAWIQCDVSLFHSALSHCVQYEIIMMLSRKQVETAHSFSVHCLVIINFISIHSFSALIPFNCNSSIVSRVIFMFYSKVNYHENVALLLVLHLVHCLHFDFYISRSLVIYPCEKDAIHQQLIF